MRAAAALLFAVVAAGCASGEMQPPDMPSVTQELRVRISEAGFVVFEDERQPVEAAVLRLRQRVRPLPDDERSGIRVTVSVGEQAEDVSATRDFLLDQLQIMGVIHARVE